MMRSLLALMVFACFFKQAYASVEKVGDLPPPSMEAFFSSSKQPSDTSETKLQLIQEMGHTTGFRGGKAERAYELRQSLESRSPTLDRLYDFRTLISKEGWLPPVIDEAIDIAHITDDQIRMANHVYEIVSPERFVSNPPSWRKWLLSGLLSGSERNPDLSLIIKNSTQRKLWKKSVKKGWQEGRESAEHVLESNFNRLTRDYRGMLLYSQLLRQGFIKAPVISDRQKTVSGNGKKLVTGDRIKRIKERAEFVPDKTQWKPVIHGEQPH